MNSQLYNFKGSTVSASLPVVFTKDGQVFANSHDVAAFFGKRHTHVLDQVDNLLISLAAEISATLFINGLAFNPTVSASLPVVFTKDGQVFANSRDVAKFFGKANKDVNTAIRVIIDGLQAIDNERRFFTPNENNDLTGTFVDDYDMTRDGFTMLVMGFKGSDALKFKLAYIAQFNAMEAALRNPFEIPTTLSGALLLAGELAAKVEAGELENKRVAQLLLESDTAMRTTLNLLRIIR